MHSGKLGDIIYALPAIKAIGGGELFLQTDSPHGFTLKDAEAILPLLRVQPYIYRADIWNGETNLSSFEPFRRLAMLGSSMNIADCHLRIVNVRSAARQEPWIYVKSNSKVSIGKAVFSWNPNYPGIPGFWPKCIELFRGRSLFVGHQRDFDVFRTIAAEVEYIPTNDLLEVAEVISACEVFIGSQSCPYAIAEGLKHKSVQETCPWVPNCIFERSNALHVRSAVDINRIQPFLNSPQSHLGSL